MPCWRLAVVAVGCAGCDIWLTTEDIARVASQWGACNGLTRLAVRLRQRTHGGCCGGGAWRVVTVAQGGGEEREQSEGGDYDA